MKKSVFLFASLLCAAAAFAEESAPAKAAAPAPKPYVHPYSDYGEAMASVKGDPMAVEWHNLISNRLDAVVTPDALAADVASVAAADALLAEVKDAYQTDPLVATRIAAVSQFVMCRKRAESPARRLLWTDALLRAAEGTASTYRVLFFLDQLRWCALPEQRARVAAIGEKAKDKAVADFAKVVAASLK